MTNYLISGANVEHCKALMTAAVAETMHEYRRINPGPTSHIRPWNVFCQMLGSVSGVACTRARDSIDQYKSRDAFEAAFRREVWRQTPPDWFNKSGLQALDKCAGL